MKWYKAKKKKPYPGETVLILPSFGGGIAKWNHRNKRWSSRDTYLSYHDANNIEKWAYIDYPKGSFEKTMCSRFWRRKRRIILSWFGLEFQWPRDYIPNAKARIGKRKIKYPLW